MIYSCFGETESLINVLAQNDVKNLTGFQNLSGLGLDFNLF